MTKGEAKDLGREIFSAFIKIQQPYAENADRFKRIDYDTDKFKGTDKVADNRHIKSDNDS